MSAMLRALGAACVLAAAGALFAPPAHAADASTATQVRVRVSELSPRVIKADSVITVAGTLTNTSPGPLESPMVRLQTGLPLRSTAALDAADANPPKAEAHACDFHNLNVDLPPHRSRPFSVSCPAARLGLQSTGVYPLMVNVNAAQNHFVARVGEAHTYLPYFAQRPAAPTHVSWLWPIIDRPHRLADRTFRDDQLAGELAPGGRLARLVRIGLSTTAQLTVVVDPNLLAEAAAMRQPYHLESGRGVIEHPALPAAAQWLTQLGQLARRPNVTVVALPYGDPDLVGLENAGMGEKIATAYSQGQAVVAQYLGGTPTERLAWPPEGQLDDKTFYTLGAQGFAGIVLDSTALPGTGSAGQGAVSALPAQGTTTRVLVSDHTLDAIAGQSRFPTGARLAEQRFLAGLAMITVQSPNDARSVLIAPPRQWSVPTPYAGRLLGDTAAVPFAQPVSSQSLLSVPPTTARGPLAYRAASALAPQQVAQIRGVVRELDGFREALSNAAANALLTPYYQAAFATDSWSWQGRPRDAAPFVGRLVAAVANLVGKVSIVVPEKGTYSLASSSSPLVLTVQNSLSVPVRVRIELTARGAAGFHAEPVNVTIPPSVPPNNTRVTVKVPTHVERSGEFSVLARVLTSNGEQLGQPVPLKVRSTAYGTITLAITGGAFALLLLLVARRLYRRFTASRQRPSIEPTGRPVEHAAP